jgi:hypothetical protein
MMGYDSLQNYYKTIFALMHHHKYSLHDLENMMVWEKLIYIDLLQNYIKEENQKLKDKIAAQRGQKRN